MKLEWCLLTRNNNQMHFSIGKRMKKNFMPGHRDWTHALSSETKRRVVPQALYQLSHRSVHKCQPRPSPGSVIYFPFGLISYKTRSNLSIYNHCLGGRDGLVIKTLSLTLSWGQCRLGMKARFESHQVQILFNLFFHISMFPMIS